MQTRLKGELSTRDDREDSRWQVWLEQLRGMINTKASSSQVELALSEARGELLAAAAGMLQEHDAVQQLDAKVEAHRRQLERMLTAALEEQVWLAACACDV